ncbi:hypothetical protein [Floccifex sp.]|uniref:hypothetical protein n=1 Tax=Floccifex sp. TaxID=2815810 RepID=UPI003F105ED9
MNEDELIKKLAEPIIRQIERMSTQYDGKISQLPQIKFVFEQTNEPIVIDGIEITDEIIQKLENYLQDELEMICSPTMLH